MIFKTGKGNLDYVNDTNPNATTQQNKVMANVGNVVATGYPYTRTFEDWLQTHNLTVTGGTPPAYNLQMGEVAFLNVLNTLQYQKIAG